MRVQKSGTSVCEGVSGVAVDDEGWRLGEDGGNTGYGGVYATGYGGGVCVRVEGLEKCVGRGAGERGESRESTGRGSMRRQGVVQITLKWLQA